MSIASEIEAGIIEAAQQTGDGTALRGTLLRNGYDASRTEWQPDRGTPQEFPFNCVATRFSARDRLDSSIRESDVKLLVGADSIGTRPRTDDTIRMEDGTIYSIEMVWPLAPGGTDLLYTIQARE